MGLLAMKLSIIFAALSLFLGGESHAKADVCSQIKIVSGQLKFVNPEHSKTKAVLVNIDTNIQAYASLSDDNTILLNWLDTRDNKLITTAEITSSGAVTMQTVDGSSTQCLEQAQLHFIRANTNAWALVNKQTVISLWQGPFPSHWLEDMPITDKR
jgi:hypothetical protein